MDINSNRQSFRSAIAQSWKSARGMIASDRLRRIRALLFQIYVLITLLAFAALTVLANAFPVFQPDVYITRDLQTDTASWHWFGYLLQAVSYPGYAIESIVIIIVVVAFLAIFGLRWESISALFAGVSSGLLNYIVKTAVHRPRPTSNLVEVFQNISGYSFPSGHVMFYMAFFGFLLFLTFTLVKRTWWRYLLMTLLILLILLVGVSRMYLGEHWASDVLGGYLLGSLDLILSIMFYRWGKASRVVKQPVAPTVPAAAVPPEEKKEVQEALQNPLLPKKEVVKEEQKIQNDQHSNRA